MDILPKLIEGEVKLENGFVHMERIDTANDKRIRLVDPSVNLIAELYN